MREMTDTDDLTPDKMTRALDNLSRDPAGWIDSGNRRQGWIIQELRAAGVPDGVIYNACLSALRKECDR